MSKALDAAGKHRELHRQSGGAWALTARILASKQNRLKEALKAAIHAVALDLVEDLVLLKADLPVADGQATAEESLTKALDKDMMNGELRARIATRYLLMAALMLLVLLDYTCWYRSCTSACCRRPTSSSQCR